MNSESTKRCPRCGEGHLRRWHELNEEDQMVAQRLPAASDYTASERETTHRWCPRCWYEETQGVQHDA